MPDDTKSKIAELEKELYSKDFKPHRVEDVVPHKETTPSPVWEKVTLETSSFIEDQQRRHLIMKKFVKISIGFFIIATFVTAFIWWKGANIISGDNIGIDISAPLSVAGGEPFETTFVITNNNKVDIDSANLLIEYPVGFYSVADNSDLPRVSKDLGIITPGQSVTERVNALLYGEDNTNKEVFITLEYRTADSNAVLKKTTSFMVKVASSPVNVSLQIPKEVSSGQEVTFSVDVTSNSKDPISSLVVSATYPSGFSFERSNPTSSYSTNTWTLSNLKPQEKRTISITGIIEGQENEEKATKISVGTQSTRDERQIGVIYNATTESSVIMKPVLGIDVAINNNHSDNNVASLGKGVKVEIFWQNNNPTKVTDAGIEVKLKGSILDRYSIYASSGGFYRSIDNTIVWDKTGNSALGTLDPGANGVVSFSFSPVSLGIDSATLIKNPQMIFEVRAHAVRISDNSAPQEITTFATRNVKFETDLHMFASGYYFSGAFQNTGPMPPRADKETTYTILLSVRNSSNSVSNSIVKTTLPIYVKWLNNVSPEGEGITYNDITNEVSWNVGRISPGGARDASFQISFTPSVSQINTTPFLTGDFSLVATDDFTNTQITDKRSALSTYISSDPQFSPNDANVVN